MIRKYLYTSNQSPTHNCAPDTSPEEPFKINILRECFDECVLNDLPQYLIRINDMRICSRTELWEDSWPLLGTLEAEMLIQTISRPHDEMKIRQKCKDDIKQLLKYAIFSHRWSTEEPEFRHMPRKFHPKQFVPTGLGYKKLQRFCEKAKEFGCKYAWSDTCCINKESSSELEEAIRSMYRWYQDAFVCIVYLGKSSVVEEFAQEPWFTRGWTLQELLAPKRLRMYGKNWDPVCPEVEEVRGGDDFPFPNDKLSSYMLHFISKITRIHFLDIRDFDPMSPEPIVSTKMRWASKRKTTRVEDMAYSLLGIFDIVMPIAYGEGGRAFQRLLEAIAQRSSDPSFFAWAGPCSRYSMALPASPASYEVGVSIDTPYCQHDYTLQKRGIRLKLLVIQVEVVNAVTHSGCELRPLPSPSSNLKIVGNFKRDPRSELALANNCAVGVLDFEFDTVEEHGQAERGHISPRKRHFCIFMQTSRKRALSGVELVCRRIDTGDVLPLIECKSEYRDTLWTVLLEHTHSFIV